MGNTDPGRLSRRERQIMEALYRRGSATVVEVRDELPDPPSPAAVRSALLLLERKGYVRSSSDGVRNVYRPAVAREKARRAALWELVSTFFRGSREEAVTALLEDVTEEELERIEALIEERRRSEEDR